MFRLLATVVPKVVPKSSTVNCANRFFQFRTMHSLLKNQAYINGKWVSAADNNNFKVINPANQEVVAEVPDMNVPDVQSAIDSAYDTFHSKSWQNTTAKERSTLLKVI